MLRHRLRIPTQLSAVVVASIMTINAAADDTVKFVLGYDGLAAYANAVASASEPDRNALFRDLVHSTYFDDCSGDGGRRAMSRQYLSTPPEDVAALADVVQQIQQSDALDRIRRAASESIELLPIDSLTVCVFVVPPDSDMAGFVIDVFRGVFGFSETPGVLWLQLIPTDGWLDEIFPGFSHEYFHAAAHPDNPMGTADITLLDMLFNEGGADSFTALLYPDFVPSWTQAITLEQEIELWPFVRENMNSGDMGLIQNVLYGNGEDIPNQAGYTIGYQIVQGYLAAHPDDPPLVWSRVDPKTVLAESGYADRVARKE